MIKYLPILSCCISLEIESFYAISPSLVMPLNLSCFHADHWTYIQSSLCHGKLLFITMFCISLKTRMCIEIRVNTLFCPNSFFIHSSNMYLCSDRYHTLVMANTLELLARKLPQATKCSWLALAAPVSRYRILHCLLCLLVLVFDKPLVTHKELLDTRYIMADVQPLLFCWLTLYVQAWMQVAVNISDDTGEPWQINMDECVMVSKRCPMLGIHSLGFCFRGTY